MTQTELLALAKSCGFTASAPLDPASIELKQAVRDMCKENTCGQYGKRWSCPPGCGNLEQCRTQLSGYSTGLLVQTTGAIEDSFDFEGIQAIEQQHKQHFDAMHEALRPLYPKLLPLLHALQGLYLSRCALPFPGEDGFVHGGLRCAGTGGLQN